MKSLPLKKHLALLSLGTLLPISLATADTSINGLIEIEASYQNSYEDNTSSNIAVATVEVAIDSQLNEDVFTHILLLHEEGDTPLSVDEAIITLRNVGGSPLELTAGQMYAAFGKLETYMVSDPLPLELAETNETAIQITLPTGPFNSTVYLFQGKSSETSTESDNADKFGFHLEYSNDNVTTGINYISSLAETNNMSVAIEENDGDPNNNSLNTLSSTVAGAGAYVDFHTNGYSVIAEYISALDTFKASDFGANGNDATPAAYQLEFIYAKGKHTFALGYQGTEDAQTLALPKTRWLAAVSTASKADTTMALEFSSDQDYDTNEGGKGKSSLGITAQLAVAF